MTTTIYEKAENRLCTSVKVPEHYTIFDDTFHVLGRASTLLLAKKAFTEAITIRPEWNSETIRFRQMARENYIKVSCRQTGMVYGYILYVREETYNIHHTVPIIGL